MVTNIRQAKAYLSQLVERAAAGEEIIIARAGKPVARLVPYQESAGASRRPGSMKGRIKILPGFDQADDALAAMFVDDPD